MSKRHEEPVLVTRSTMPPLEEYVELLKPIWDSAWLTNMGAYHEAFKEQLKTRLRRRTWSCSSMATWPWS